MLFGEGPINQPFEEEKIEEKHEAAQNDEGDTQKMRTHERAELLNKPAQLWIELRTQRCSPWRRFDRKFSNPRGPPTGDLKGDNVAQICRRRLVGSNCMCAKWSSPFSRSSLERMPPRTPDTQLWLCVPLRSRTTKNP